MFIPSNKNVMLVQPAIITLISFETYCKYCYFAFLARDKTEIEKETKTSNI